MAPYGRYASADDLIREALLLALPRLQPRKTRHGNPSAWPLESDLATAIVKSMIELGVDSWRVGTGKRYIEHDWDPRPKGLDLYVTGESGTDLAIAAELKLEEVEQTMWDCYKLIAARKLPASPFAFLILGAHDSTWSGRPCTELFPETPGASQVIETVGLFQGNRKQYAADLKYSGRMQSVPTSVRATAILAGARATHYERLEFRIASVEPADSTPIPCTDGWPAGVDPPTAVITPIKSGPTLTCRQ